MNEDALKERLRVVAKEKGITFNETWKQLLLERFLSRLARSKYQEKFIFKGGLLLAQYLVIGRETTDADFLIKKIKGEAPIIEKAVKDITSVDLQDGFTFSWSEIEELLQPHMQYRGFRISLNSSLGKMKDKIQLDIGFGDVVEDVAANFHPFEYKGKPIFEGEISLRVYPVETIFAEKLETIISKGAVNSRMKDYHDLLLMAREPGLLHISKLKESVIVTFNSRESILKLPIEFDPSGLSTLQKLWAQHLNGLGLFKQKLDLPDNIAIVLKELNTWLSTKKLIE